MIVLTLSEKQELGRSLLNDPQVVEVYWGGSAGGGKSLMICLWMLERIRQYPGIRIGLGRKELTRLKQTTIITLLREAHPMMNVTSSSFDYSEYRGLVKYRNGSEIQLVDLNRQPSDPEFDTLGSLNFTDVVIEEAGEITKKAKDVFNARKNRFLNNEYNLVGKAALTGNPSQNFTYSEYYEPYKKGGGGDYQKWQVGEVEVRGKLKPAYRAFVRSLPIDNPFLSQNYIEVLKSLPPQERRRLYEGNWDYVSDESMLFKPELLNKASISEQSEGERFMGVDVADKGKDKTMVTLIVNNVAVDQHHIITDKNNPTPISEQSALGLIRFAQTNGFEQTNARQIAIEGNGVGVGMRDFMRSKGWNVTEYTATSQTRSQAYYDSSQDMDKGELKLLNSLTTIDELRKQLMAHTYEMDERLQPKVLPKKLIKEILGYSPDEADSLIIANWIRRKGKGISRVLF